VSTGYLVDDMVEILADHEWLPATSIDFERLIIRHGAHGRTDGDSTTAWFDKVGDPIAWTVTREAARRRYVRRTYDPPVTS
jgi:hypothetical protein